MPEETNNSTPVTNVAPAVVAAEKSKSNISIKDFFIPLSIVIAGALVGSGLFFGGSSFTGGNAQVVQNNQQQQPAADTTNKIDKVTDADHVKGDINAPVKIVEYSDFDCPFCSRFHESMSDFIETSDGNVAWVYRQFPLEQLHPNAPTVAHASECVAELGGNDAFWKFTDSYFAAKGAGDATPAQTLITKLANEAGVATGVFNDCMESGRHTKAVETDMTDAVETGGRGTPWSIVIGPTGKTYPINGAQSATVIAQVVKLALEEAK